ncbi:MAG: hypothetical protein CMJ90_00725 [Planctomycetes bacterium]|nr:hypothetical protein [Planctomycetota bacterium]
MHDVKTKKPNFLGLHDMHGNVKEWCRRVKAFPTWYAGRLGKYPTRGGSYMSPCGGCRASARLLEHGDDIARTIGFRIIARRKM